MRFDSTDSIIVAENTECPSMAFETPLKLISKGQVQCGPEDDCAAHDQVFDRARKYLRQHSDEASRTREAVIRCCRNINAALDDLIKELT